MEISPYYEKSIDMLALQKKFKTTKIRSKFVKFHPMILTLSLVIKSRNKSVYYNIFVCQYCGFSFSEEFSNYFAPGMKEEILNKYTAQMDSYAPSVKNEV